MQNSNIVKQCNIEVAEEHTHHHLSLVCFPLRLLVDDFDAGGTVSFSFSLSPMDNSSLISLNLDRKATHTIYQPMAMNTITTKVDASRERIVSNISFNSIAEWALSTIKT